MDIIKISRLISYLQYQNKRSYIHINIKLVDLQNTIVFFWIDNNILFLNIQYIIYC